MELFFLCTRKTLIKQINEFISKNNLITMVSSLGLKEELFEDDFFQKDLNVLIGQKEDLLKKDIHNLKYIESKRDFLHVQQLYSREENKITSARVSWLPNESDIARKIGKKFKSYLSKKNNLGVLAFNENQSYLNKTLSRKYYWNDEIESINKELFDWMGTIRIKPQKKM